MKKKPQVKVNGRTLYVEVAEYNCNHAPAVLLNERNGELYAVLTVNVPGAPVPPGCIIVDTNNVSPAVVGACVSAGYISGTGMSVRSGFCDYPVYELLLDAGAA